MNYIKERNAIAEKAKTLLSLSSQCEFQKINPLIESFIQRIEKDQFIITFVGEFNRGKSTVLNAMLGVDILPTEIDPTTALIHIIHYANQPFLKEHLKDGTTKEIPFNKSALKDYTACVDFDTSKTKYIELGYPLDFLKDGTVLVDTPGVNDLEKQRMEVTYGYMPISDASVFILNINQFVSNSEKQFLDKHVLANNIPTLFFLANKIDYINESDIRPLIKSGKERLEKIINQKDVKIYPISSIDALGGKINKNDELLEKSKFVEFENALKTFVMGGEKNKSKLKGINQEFNALCVTLLENIEIENKQLALSIDELKKAKENISGVKGKKQNIFKKLTQYIEEQSSSLLTKAETSLLEKQNDMVEQLQADLEMHKGDLKDVINTALPHKIKTGLKGWIKQNEPHIEQGYKVIVNKSIIGFQKHFAKKPMMDDLLPNSNIQTEEVVFDTPGENIEAMNTNFQLAGAGALAVIAGLATGGILPIVFGGMAGMNIGGMLGKYISKDEIENQKNMLKMALPKVVEEAVHKTKESITQHYEYYFNKLESNLTTEFDNVILELEKEIDQKLGDFTSNQSKIGEKQKHYKKIIQQINQLQGA